MTFIRNISQRRFKEMVEATIDQLYGSVYNLCGDKQLCEDIIQEAYLRLWKNFDDVTEDETVIRLLRTYARNIFLDEMRKAARKQESLHEHMPETSVDTTTDYIRNRELNSELQSAINKLPRQQQIIFRLHKEHALSYKQIAEKLKIATGTIEVQMNRALKSLKNQLGHLNGD